MRRPTDTAGRRRAGALALMAVLMAGLVAARPALAEGTPAAPAPTAPAPTAPAPTAAAPAPAASPAPAAQRPAPGTPAAGTPATVVDDDQIESVLGKKVKSPAGEDMGRIVDVLVDRTGEVRAAVIDFGGFFGVGTRKIAVDWQALHFGAGAKSDAVVADLPPERLRVSPVYKEGEPVVILGASQAAPAAAPAAPAANTAPAAAAPAANTAPAAAAPAAAGPAPAAAPATAPK